jgi:hypothetical protein
MYVWWVTLIAAFARYLGSDAWHRVRAIELVLGAMAQGAASLATPPHAECPGVGRVIPIAVAGLLGLWAALPTLNSDVRQAWRPKLSVWVLLSIVYSLPLLGVVVYFSAATTWCAQLVDGNVWTIERDAPSWAVSGLGTLAFSSSLHIMGFEMQHDGLPFEGRGVYRWIALVVRVGERVALAAFMGMALLDYTNVPLLDAMLTGIWFMGFGELVVAALEWLRLCDARTYVGI